MTRWPLALAVTAACGSSTPATTTNHAPDQQPDLAVTHLRVVIELLYDNTCPAAHHFVVYVDGVERGAIDPPCKPQPPPSPNGRMVVTESGTPSVELPPFDVPAGAHRISARDTIAGWVAAEKELSFPARDARSMLEVLPIRFGLDEDDKPRSYVRDLVYEYITM